MKTFLKNAFLLIAMLVSQGFETYCQKVRKLKNLDVESIGLVIDSTYMRLPGYPFPIAVHVVTKDKGTFYTRGFGGGSLYWSNFDIRVKGGDFINGRIHVSPKLYPGDYIEIICTGKTHPWLTFSKVLRLNYVASFNVFPLGTYQKIPGERLSIGFKMDYDNGCNETVTSWSQNYRLFNSLKFQFYSVGGEVKNNRFYISSDFANIPGHKAYVLCSTPKMPYVSDSLGILLDYRGQFSYYTKGSDGIRGLEGCNGSDGSNGSESCDGKNGTDGSCGEPGYPGEPGDELEVYCDAYFDTILKTDLLYVEIENFNKQTLKKYLINPDGGSLHVVSRGGDGGNGGPGGNGGDGGKGGDGKKITTHVRDTSGVRVVTTQEKGGNGGNGGSGGRGGYGGPGGPGGRIVVLYTNAAKPYLNHISVSSIGGSGGFSGSGGAAGSGGTGGFPGGSNGRSGNSGSTGYWGYSGENGWVNYFSTDD